MAKAVKAKKTASKKRGEKDIVVKTDLTADQLLQLAIKTPLKKTK